MALPEFFAVKQTSNRRGIEYLAVIEDDHAKQGYVGIIKEVVNPRTKFAVERAGDGLVHVRSCLNNRYWVRSSKNEGWIVAQATEKEEDKSAWNCTLFKVDLSGDNVSFTHVQLGQKLKCSLLSPTGSDLYLTASPYVSADALSLIHYDSLVILPKYVVFQSDIDTYYKIHDQDWKNYLRASSEDIAYVGNVCEIFYTEHGDIRIKSTQNGMFWRRTPQWIWIWADSLDTSHNDMDSLFTVFYNNTDGVISLKNKGNNQFCRRHPDLDWKFDCLHASAATMTKETRLRVLEPVHSRSIEVLEFRLKDARIYNERLEALTTSEARNDSDIKKGEMEIGMTFEETISYSWSNSISITLGLAATFKAGIPLIAENEFEISTQFNDTYQWGETKEVKKTVHGTYKTDVPPKSKVKVTMLGTKGTCDIPFSYLQTDQYFNGDRISEVHHDGLYKGVNAYKFTYESVVEPLPKNVTTS